MQFHIDYRDTITAFYKLTNGKQLFNIANAPVIKTQPGVKEVKNIVNDFIKRLNCAVELFQKLFQKINLVNLIIL